MEPQKTEVSSFSFIGIGITTSPETEAQDLAALWNRFFAEHLIDRLPGFSDSTLLSVYTGYQPDGRYDAYVGCRMIDLADVPEGFTGLEIPGGSYSLYLARGPMPETVMKAWQLIREQNKDRAFAFDWDVYGPKSQNGENSEVEIYVSTRQPL